MNAESVILKTDRQGRVRTSPAQREALLNAFECSGLSGMKFAALHGVKYPSFGNWVQQRKRHQSTSAAAGECGADKVTGERRIFVGVVGRGRRQRRSEVRHGRICRIDPVHLSPDSTFSPATIDISEVHGHL